jgi:hypothetical protein
MVAVIRRNSCRLSQQAIFVVQSTQDRMNHNFTVVRNPMPMSVWRDMELDWRIGARATHLTTLNLGTIGGSNKSIVCLNLSFFTNAAYAFSVVLTEA